MCNVCTCLYNVCTCMVKPCTYIVYTCTYVCIGETMFIHGYTTYVHVYKQRMFTSCLNRFPEDGEFVQTCLYCVHTHINIYERVCTMYIQIYYIMNMYVQPAYI